LGKSFAHPLVVLVILNSHGDDIRIAVAAGRRLGNPVQRNRAKRRIRAAIQPLLTSICPGHDLILIARLPLIAAGFEELLIALRSLLLRAEILKADEN
jgi:ribonuclease P protein component